MLKGKSKKKIGGTHASSSQENTVQLPEIHPDIAGQNIAERFNMLPKSYIAHLLSKTLSAGIIPEIFKLPAIKEHFFAANDILDRELVMRVLLDLECKHNAAGTMSFLNKKAFEVVEFMYDHCGLGKIDLTPNVSKSAHAAASATITHFAAKHNNIELLEYLHSKNLLQPMAIDLNGRYPIQYTKRPATLKKKVDFDDLLNNSGKFLKKFTKIEFPKSNVDSFFITLNLFKQGPDAKKLDDEIVNILDKIVRIKASSFPDSYKVNLTLYHKLLQKMLSFEGALSREEIDFAVGMPVLLTSIVDPIYALELLKQTGQICSVYSHILDSLKEIQFDTVGIVSNMLSIKYSSDLQKTLLTTLDSLSKGELSAMEAKILAIVYFKIAEIEYLHQDYIPSSIHSNKSILLAIDDNILTSMLVQMINSFNVVGDVSHLQQFHRHLSTYSGYEDLAQVLDYKLKLAMNEIDLDHIFGALVDHTTPDMGFLLYLFIQNSGFHISGDRKRLSIKESLWLDLVFEYAEAHKMLEEAGQLLQFLREQKVACIVTETYMFLLSSTDKTDLDDSIKVLDSKDIQTADRSVSWNLIKIMVSVANDDVQTYTFKAIDNVERFLKSGKACGARVKEVFASGCQLVAQHLMDQKDCNISQIEGYLNYADTYGSIQQKKGLFGDYERLKLIKTPAQEPDSSDQTNSKELELDGAPLLKDAASLIPTCDAQGEVSSSVPSAPQEEENKPEDLRDRASTANYLLRNFVFQSQKATPKSTITGYKVTLKGESYRFEEGQNVSDIEGTIFKISNLRNIYAVISSKLIPSDKFTQGKILHALENGLDSSAPNKVIHVGHSYKIKHNQMDDRLYATSGYKFKMKDANVTLVLFDKSGNHNDKTVKSLSSEKFITYDLPAEDIGYFEASVSGDNSVGDE